MNWRFSSYQTAMPPPIQTHNAAFGFRQPAHADPILRIESPWLPFGIRLSQVCFVRLRLNEHSNLGYGQRPLPRTGACSPLVGSDGRGDG